MDLLLWKHQEFDQHYNCSFYDVNQIPLEQRQHKIAGSLFLVAYVVFMILYCLCIYGMCVTEHRQQTAYRLMLALGFNHLLGLQTAGLINGLFAIFGVVHCTFPVLNYTLSTLALANWYSSSLANLILAINRCCELYSSKVADFLFGGRKIYLWQFGPVIYAGLGYIFDTGRSYSSIWMAFLYDPHAGYSNNYGGNGYYTSRMHLIHNNTVLTLEIFSYTTIILMYYRMKSKASTEFQLKIHHERRIYLQILIIGMSHLMAGILYLVMQFIEVNFAISLLGTSAYFISQATPSIVYISMNKSIRSAIWKKWCALKKSLPTNANLRVSHAGEEQTVPSS